MGELKCSVVQDLLVTYLDGEVRPETHREISGHLASCGECRKLAADLKVGAVALKNLGKPAKGGEQEIAVLMAARRKIWLLGGGAILIIFSLAGLTGFGMFEFFKASDIPLLIKIGFGAGLLGVGLILAVLILERIKEQRSERDDFGKY